MRTVIFILLGIAASFLMMAISVLPSAPEKGLPIASVSLASIFGLYLFSRMHQRKVKQAQEDGTERVHALVQKIVNTGVPLAVEGSSRLVVALIIIIFGLALLVDSIIKDNHIWPWAILITGTLITAGAVILNDALLAFRKPIIIFSAQGITTPWSEEIPWQHIYGITLHERRHRGFVVALELVLRIKGYQPLQTSSLSLRLGRRLRGLSRGRLRIRLQRTSETPQVILGVAKGLWNIYTGRNYLWTPLMPNKIHQSLIKLDELKMDVPAPDASPGDIEEWSKSLKSEITVVRKWRRRMHWEACILLILFAGGMIYVFWMS